MSRVGKKSITLPDKVTVKVNGSSVQVEGPKGKLSWTLPEGITATVEGNQLSVDRVGESRQLRALHGTNRSLLNNMSSACPKASSRTLKSSASVSAPPSRATSWI